MQVLLRSAARCGVVIASLALLVVPPPAFGIDLGGGKSATFKDPAGTSKDSARVVFSRDPGLVDPLPDPRAEASTLQITSDTASSGDVVLDPSFWTPAGASGFVYNDTTGSRGGIRKIVVASSPKGGKLSVLAKGDAYGATAITGPVGFVQVRLSIGSSHSYCGRFESPPSTAVKNRADLVSFKGPSGACCSESRAETCNGHGTPDGSCTGNCACDSGWAGATCAECAPGYALDAGVCADIDECITGDFDCPSYDAVWCSNTPGSYTCRGLGPVGLLGRAIAARWVTTACAYPGIPQQRAKCRSVASPTSLFLADLDLYDDGTCCPSAALGVWLPEMLSLTHIDLGNNPVAWSHYPENAYGPPYVWAIPSSIGNLTNLIILRLENTDLLGPIPWSIASLTSLTDLRLYPAPGTWGDRDEIIASRCVENLHNGRYPWDSFAANLNSESQSNLDLIEFCPE